MNDWTAPRGTPDTAAARRWARRRGHPDYLWPDVPIDAWRSALRAIERTVADVLSDRPAALPDDVTGALGIAALTSGTGPLLGRWIEDGRVAADERTATLLARHLDHGRRRWTRMAERLEQALHALGAQGIRTTVLKGMHTAGWFPEPGTRPAADIDLAVDGADIGPAERVLAELGYDGGPRRLRPYRREWRWPGEAPASLELTHVDNPIAIEVHGGLDRDVFGVRRIAFDRFAPRVAGSTASVGSAWPETTAVLGLPVLWLYLAVHAAEELHRLQLLRLVELVLVARCDLASPEDWVAVRDLARRLDAGRFAYPAAALAARLAPDAIDAATIAAFRADASPRMRRFVDELRPADAQRFDRLSLADRFLWPKGAVETARRAAYLLWPSRSRGVGAVYAERVWRVLRGRVSLGSG